jgi:hypothetical protein
MLRIQHCLDNRFTDGGGETETSVKNRIIPIIGRGVLYDCEMLKIPHCLDNRLTDGGGVVSLKHRQRSIHQKDFIFCL